MTQLPGIIIDFKRPDKKEMENIVLEGVSEVVSETIDKIKPDIEKRTGNLIRAGFEANSTYRAMRRNDSELTYSLGETLLSVAAEKIVNYIIDSIRVKKTNRRVNGKPTIGIEVEVLGGKGNIVDRILSASELQKYIKYRESNERTGSDYEIPWLEWLLTKGDGGIIYGYDILYGSFKTPPSRTGGAIMIQKSGEVFRVPPQHSGTPRDNFITRVLDKQSLFDEIGHNIERLLERKLR